MIPSVRAPRQEDADRREENVECWWLDEMRLLMAILNEDIQIIRGLPRRQERGERCRELICNELLSVISPLSDEVRRRITWLSTCGHLQTSVISIIWSVSASLAPHVGPVTTNIVPALQRLLLHIITIRCWSCQSSPPLHTITTHCPATHSLKVCLSPQSRGGDNLRAIQIPTQPLLSSPLRVLCDRSWKELQLG